MPFSLLSYSSFLIRLIIPTDRTYKRFLLSKYITEVNIHSYQSNHNTRKGHKIHRPKMNKWWSCHFQFYLLKLWHNICNGWLLKQLSSYDLHLSTHFDIGKTITWQIRYSIRFSNKNPTILYFYFTSLS